MKFWDVVAAALIIALYTNMIKAVSTPWAEIWGWKALGICILVPFAAIIWWCLADSRFDGTPKE